MKPVALIFSGQGTQKVGMMRDLVQEFPSIVRPILQQVDEALQLKLSSYVEDGPAETLQHTRHAQPAILMHSIAVLRVLQNEKDFHVNPHSCSFVLGHSLGEYSAYVAAGALPLDEAVRLVHLRGCAMEEAMEAESEPGAMAALFPVTQSNAADIANAAAEKTAKVCDVANFNSITQTVISGHRSAVEEAVSIGKKQKLIRRGTFLNVSAPFHCSLMKPAAQKLSHELEGVQFNELAVPLVTNVTAEPMEKVSPADIRASLVEQVTSPVKWSQSLEFCRRNGVDTFIEFGLGGVLTSLAKKEFKNEVETIALGSSQSIVEFVKRSQS